jgi:hypothetical protein
MKTKQLHHLHKSLIINLCKLSHGKNTYTHIIWIGKYCMAISIQGFKFVSFGKTIVKKCITYKFEVSIMTFL